MSEFLSLSFPGVALREHSCLAGLYSCKAKRLKSGVKHSTHWRSCSPTQRMTLNLSIPFQFLQSFHSVLTLVYFIVRRAFTPVLLNFLSILHEKIYFFLFYTFIFTKHPHQFIYSTHLFNKIFIILLIFIIHSLTVPLSHRPTDPQPPSPPSHHHHHHQKPKAIKLEIDLQTSQSKLH